MLAVLGTILFCFFFAFGLMLPLRLPKVEKACTSPQWQQLYDVKTANPVCCMWLGLRRLRFDGSLTTISGERICSRHGRTKWKSIFAEAKLRSGVAQDHAGQLMRQKHESFHLGLQNCSHIVHNKPEFSHLTASFIIDHPPLPLSLSGPMCCCRSNCHQTEKRTVIPLEVLFFIVAGIENASSPPRNAKRQPSAFLRPEIRSHGSSASSQMPVYRNHSKVKVKTAPVCSYVSLEWKGVSQGWTEMCVCVCGRNPPAQVTSCDAQHTEGCIRSWDWTSLY